MNPQSLRDRGAIVGIGETAYLRRSERPTKHLAVEAIQKAIADAGLTPADIDGIITDSNVTPPRVPMHDVMGSLNMPNISFIAHGPPAGPGIIYCPLLATMAIEHGLARNVLAFYVIDTGSAVGGAYGMHSQFRHKVSFEFPYGFYSQPVYFAAIARRYQYEFGYSAEEMTNGLGAVAVACRKHAVLHPDAQMRLKPMSLEDYRKSRVLATPLRFPDVCLNTDGATAFVVTSADRAKDCPHPPVYVMGAAHATVPVGADAYLSQHPDYVGVSAAPPAAARALQMAGVTLKDMDFAEIYDCFTIAVIMELEGAGFCPKGEGIRWVQGGRIELGGELPMNTHGGHLSHAYLQASAHVIEAVKQLRHDAGDRQVGGAEIGWVSGDPWAHHSALILRR